MDYLVFGANGYIGSYLYARMTEDNLNVTGTRHCKTGSDDLIEFDILKDAASKVTKMAAGQDRTAIICIAQTNIDQCKSQYELSRKINVTYTRKLVESLMRENVHVIFISTDNVFDGRKGSYTEQDQTNAVNEYGKMKEEMEHFLLERYPDICIFRLPKVLGIERERQNLLTDLEYKLTDNEVRCIKGTKMSIVSKEDIYQACLIAAGKRLHGIYHLSSGEVYSRKELTEKFYGYMGAYDKKILELELEEFHFKDTRPLHISLDNSKFRKTADYEFESFDEIAQKYVENNRRI